MKVLVIAICLVVSVFASAGEIPGVLVNLPDGIKWAKVTDQTNGDVHLKEWVPHGKSADSSDWIIVQQKFRLERKTSAKKYLESMLKLARKSCTDVTFNGPERRNLGEIDSYWGRLMCAQVVGRDYGAFTEFRVIADGLQIFVVTSEIRLPPTRVAGAFEFQSLVEAEQTIAKLEASAQVAREQVQLCQEAGCP